MFSFINFIDPKIKDRGGVTHCISYHYNMTLNYNP